MAKKLLLIILDGVPWRNWGRLFGNLEGWVENGDARKFRMRACLPAVSGPCYASIHTGVPPQEHGVLANNLRHRVGQPDIFSSCADEGLTTGAVAHSYWSEFFMRFPFDPVRDLEYDVGDGPIHHGRFHTMEGYDLINQTTPSDADLFATLTMLCERYAINYGLLHTCTLDSMGHRFGHGSAEMDHACYLMDAQLAAWLPRWRDAGYQVIVTADHGQSNRGHHSGNTQRQRDVALYYFKPGEDVGPASESSPILSQLQLAPTILGLLDVTVPSTMVAKPFL